MSSGEAPEIDQALVTELVFGDARGGRRPAEPIQVTVARALTPADLSALAAGPPKSSAPTLLSLRHAHHQLARLIAQGVEAATIALQTGYSPTYISRIQGDPLFNELVSHYASEREAIFIDTLERMKALGITVLEELQDRLANEPAKFSQRELMEMADLLLVKAPVASRQAQGGAPPGGAGVQVNVNFISPPAREEGGEALVIEGRVA